MRAITVSEYGGAPTVTELPAPAPGPDQILITISAAGVNPMDRAIADGPGPNLVRALHDIVAPIDDGHLRVPIWRSYPLTDAAAALDAIGTAHVGGKLVPVASSGAIPCPSG